MAARILVIEDNPTNLELMKYVLAAFGHAVSQALDGEAGLEAMARERPDLVICDLQLPGIDGMEVSRRVRATRALDGIPMIAVTAFAMAGDRKRVLDAGFEGYISKPIDPQSFIERIDAFLPAALRSAAPAAGS